VKLLILISLLFVTVSCEMQNKQNTPKDDPSLYGYWIPDSVTWESTNSGHLDLDTTQRYANFKMLHLDSANNFEIWGTTFSYPRVKYDSISFEFEPGVDIYQGIWDIAQKDIHINYRKVYSPSGKKDSTSTAGTIGISYVNNDTLLIFENKTYKKTYRLDNFSLRKMDAYRNEAGIP
jgi:hypothetical protein